MHLHVLDVELSSLAGLGKEDEGWRPKRVLNDGRLFEEDLELSP